MFTQDFSTRGARETGLAIKAKVAGVFSSLTATSDDLGTDTDDIVNFGPMNSGLASNPEGATALSQTGASAHSSVGGVLAIVAIALFGLWVISRIK